MTGQYPAWSVGRSNLRGLDRQVLRTGRGRAGRAGSQRRHAAAGDGPGGRRPGSRPVGSVHAQRYSRRRPRRPGDGTSGRPQFRQRRREGHQQPGRHRGRHQRRTGNQRLPRPVALQPGSGPHTGARQLAVRHPGARPAAVGLVPTACAGQGGAAAGGVGGRPLRPPRGAAAMGHRRRSGQRTPGRVIPILRCRGVAGLAQLAACRCRRSRATPPRSAWSPTTRIWRRSTGSR